MKKFGVFIHPSYAGKEDLFKLLENLHQEYGLQFYGFEQQKSYLPPSHKYLSLYDEKKPGIDCLLVFGGDGTILRADIGAAHTDTGAAIGIALKTSAPILGINLGYLGFLSESTLQDLRKSIKDLQKNKFRVQQRMLLSCQLKHKGSVVYQGLALNDAVIFKAETPRLINIRIYSAGRFIVETRCDGVIAATPTGSTAYSLSAGGPILSPVMKAIVVSPLNPHILSIRPMVFPDNEKLLFRTYNLEKPGYLQIDGVNVHSLDNDDELTVTASKKHVNFIKLSNRTFYKILRTKLHLGK